MDKRLKEIEKLVRLKEKENEATKLVELGVAVRGKDGTTPVKGLDYLDGLDGKNGINGRDGYIGLDGKDGKNGKNGERGYIGKTGQDGKDGLDGKNGTKGQDGNDGLTAYEIAVKNGYKKSEKKWLESLEGKEGRGGLRGGSGATAYQQAVQGGYTGTLAEFIAELNSISVAGVHNDLAGLDGGTADQYYHLTSAEYAAFGTGQTATVTNVVDSRTSGGVLQKKTQALTYTNGSLTTVGVISEWTDTTNY